MNQRSIGIRQWPINCSTSLIMIHKITAIVDYKVAETYGTQQNEPTNQNKTKVPKVVKPNNHKTLGTCATNILKSPP